MMDRDDKGRTNGGPFYTAIVLLLLLGVSLLLHLIGLTLPWRGPLDSVGSWLSHNADFLLTHGIRATKLAYVYSAGPVAPADLDARLTHPSLVILWLVPFRYVLGHAEWTSRLAGISLSLIVVLFTYLIAKKILPRRESVLVLAFGALLPMEAYWGRLPSEPLMATALVTVAVYFYISNVLRPGNGAALAFLFFHFLGCMADWAAYFLPPSLVIYEWVTGRRKFLLPLVALGLQFVYFSLFLLQNVIVGGMEQIYTLLGAGVQRSVLGFSEVVGGVPVFFARIALYFTVPLVILGLVWIYRSVTAGGSKFPPAYTEEKTAFLVPLIFLTTFVLWFAAFPNYVVVHEISFHPLTPFFLLASGLAMGRIRNGRRRLVQGLVIMLVIVQLGFVLHRRFSEQNGYVVPYALSNKIEAVTDYDDHLLTHLTLKKIYYQFYCDRDMRMGVNSIADFNSAVARNGYTGYLALDLDGFLAAYPEIGETSATHISENGLQVDPELLAYLVGRYRCERLSFFYVFRIGEH